MYGELTTDVVADLLDQVEVLTAGDPKTARYWERLLASSPGGDNLCDLPDTLRLGYAMGHLDSLDADERYAGVVRLPVAYHSGPGPGGCDYDYFARAGSGVTGPWHSPEDAALARDIIRKVLTPGDDLPDADIPPEAISRRMRRAIYDSVSRDMSPEGAATVAALAESDPLLARPARRRPRATVVDPDGHPDDNKAALLEMARAGLPRPDATTLLGRAFLRHTAEGRAAYDAGLTAEILALAPAWFVDEAAAAKDALRALAREGGAIPEKGTPLGRDLRDFLKPGTPTHDTAFAAEILALAPAWFADDHDTDKAALLDLARAGRKPRPFTRLEENFTSYTRPNSPAYDPAFTAEVRKLAPEWLLVTDEDKKEALLEMARAGLPRPADDTLLDGAFIWYTRRKHSGFDAGFTATLRELVPSWFKPRRRVRDAL